MTGTNVECDVAVIGSGAIALSIVVALVEAAPKCSVALIGTQRHQGCASRASGAMLGIYGEVTPYLLNSVAGKAKIRMGREAEYLWPQWLEVLRSRGEPEKVPSIRRGTYVILNSRSGTIDDRHFESIIQALQNDQEPFELIDPRDIEGLEPLASCRPLRSLRLPNEGCIDSGRVLDALDSCVGRSPRVSRANTRAMKIIVGRNGRHGVELETGETVLARNVVIAAGTESQTLIESMRDVAKRVPPIFSGVGCSVLVNPCTPISSVIRTPNRAFACGLHVLPRDDGSLYIGATNNVFVSQAQRPMVSDITFLLQCATEQIRQSLQDALVLDIRVGNRPVSLDTFPLIGATSIDGIWVATGTYRDGFHLSPLIAQLMASWILDQSKAGFNQQFAPERLPITLYTREEAIELATSYSVATAYERGIAVPGVGQWEKTLTQMTRERVRSVYDEVGMNYVLPPDFVWEVDRFRLATRFREYFETLHSAWKAG